MANVKISGLTLASSANATQEIEVNDSLTSRKITVAQLLTYMESNIDVFIPKTSTTGSAQIPVGTEAQRDGTPSAGYFRFNTDSDKFEGYNGTAWGSVGGGATGAGSDECFIENQQTVNNSYTISANKNAGSFGPIAIADGVTVTIPTGATWTVV
jgi:hypothetical protein